MFLSSFNSVGKIQLLLSLISLASQGSAYLFQPVLTSCIYWDSLPTQLKDENPYKIHCIQDENGLQGIVNTTWKLVQADAGCYSSPEATITYLPKNGLTVTTKEPNTEQLQFTCNYKLEGIIGIIVIASASSIVIVAAFALLLTVKKKMLERSKLGLTKIEANNNEEKDEDSVLLDCNTEPPTGSKQLHNAV